MTTFIILSGGTHSFYSCFIERMYKMLAFSFSNVQTQRHTYFTEYKISLTCNFLIIALLFHCTNEFSVAATSVKKYSISESISHWLTAQSPFDADRK